MIVDLVMKCEDKSHH